VLYLQFTSAFAQAVIKLA